MCSKSVIINEADLVLNNNFTIREAAEILNVSKSVLHRHLSYKLKSLDYYKYLEIKKMFLEHNKIRHINGGLATKLKYRNR